MRLMTQKVDARYFEHAAYRAVELPFVRGCSLAVLLPDRRLDAVVDQLARDGGIDRALAGGRDVRVRLSLPRVTLDSGGIELQGILSKLGVRALFQPDADFSGISTMPTWAAGIGHRATLEVDELGATATAATVGRMALGISRDPPEIIEFRVDRPYVMLLLVRQTGAVLFASTVTEPPRLASVRPQS